MVDESVGPSISSRGCLVGAGVAGQVLERARFGIAEVEVSASDCGGAGARSSGMFSLSAGSWGAPSMNWNFFNLDLDTAEG